MSRYEACSVCFREWNSQCCATQHNQPTTNKRGLRERCLSASQHSFATQLWLFMANAHLHMVPGCLPRTQSLIL